MASQHVHGTIQFNIQICCIHQITATPFSNVKCHLESLDNQSSLLLYKSSNSNRNSIWCLNTDDVDDDDDIKLMVSYEMYPIAYVKTLFIQLCKNI